MKTDYTTNKADFIGIAGSVLCLIHCLVTPALMMTTVLAQNSHLTIGFLSLDYLFIGVNAVAVFFATRHYAPPAIKRALWGFLLLFTLGLLLEDVNPLFRYLGYAASAGLVIMHLANIRQHRLNHVH